jgi:hypothetical protein
MPMPVVQTGSEGITPAVTGTVMSVYTVAVVGDRREDFQQRPLQLIGWNRHMRTQTYNDAGHLVTSTAPPTIDLRM